MTTTTFAPADRVRITRDGTLGTVVTVEPDGLVWVMPDDELTSTGYAPAALERVDTTPRYEKRIQYDRETRDYAMYLGGEIVGYAGTYLEGEQALSSLVSDMLTHLPPAPREVECEACEGDGRVPSFAATGRYDGGYTDDCQACEGRGVVPVEVSAPKDRACTGLEHPCGKPATHFSSILLGSDIAGRPVVADESLCDECYAIQQSWQPTDTCHACRGSHATQKCPEIHQLLFAPVEPSVQAGFERLEQVRRQRRPVDQFAV